VSRQSQALVQVLNQLAPLVRRRMTPPVVTVLAVLLVGYLLAAPVLNRSLGWSLPGWRELAGVASQSAEVDAPGSATPKSTPATSSNSSSRSTEDPQASGDTPRARATEDKPPRAPAVDAQKERMRGVPSGDPLVDEIASGASRAVYTSPAGLRYTRGSQHGHRLKHLLAHTRDEPNRPGPHGVFSVSDPHEVVALVDEAYLQALQGERTRTEREGDRIVYTVDLGRTIGYVGGESGGRSGHPSVRRARLVVEDGRLITAFPVR
jgi:hypothetical protein